MRMAPSTPASAETASSPPTSPATSRSIPLAASSDGRILAAGLPFQESGRWFRSCPLQLLDCSLDSGFNGTGWLAYDLGTPQPHAYPTAVAIEADGKILVGAHQGDQAAIYALNSDGSIDKSFGTTGVATTAGAQAVTRLLIQPDGRILAGVVDPTAPQGAVLAAPIFGLARFGADGSPDSTFGTAGFVNVLGARSGSSSAFTEPPFDSIAALVLQSDGKIVVIANQDQIDSSGNFAIGTKLVVRRLSADGSTDSGFADSVDPAFDPTPYQGGSTAQAAAVTPDGNLVVVANVDSDSTAAAPHWTGIAEYETLATPAAAVTGPTASGTTGTTPVGASPSPTPLPPGQLAASIIGSLPSTVWTGQNTTLRILHHQYRENEIRRTGVALALRVHGCHVFVGRPDPRSAFNPGPRACRWKIAHAENSFHLPPISGRRKLPLAHIHRPDRHQHRADNPDQRQSDLRRFLLRRFSGVLCLR